MAMMTRLLLHFNILLSTLFYGTESFQSSFNLYSSWNICNQIVSALPTHRSTTALSLTSIQSHNNNDDDELSRYRNRSRLLESTLRHKVQSLHLSEQKLQVLQDAIKRLVVQREKESTTAKHHSTMTSTLETQEHDTQRETAEKELYAEQLLQQQALQHSARNEVRKQRYKQRWVKKQEAWQARLELLQDQLQGTEAALQQQISEQVAIMEKQQQQHSEQQEIAQAAVAAAERRAGQASDQCEEWRRKYIQSTQRIATLEARLYEERRRYYEREEEGDASSGDDLSPEQPRDTKETTTTKAELQEKSPPAVEVEVLEPTFTATTTTTRSETPPTTTRRGRVRQIATRILRVRDGLRKQVDSRRRQP